MLYLLYKIGLSLLRFASKETAYKVVSLFAKIKCRISKKDREIVKENLRAVKPDASEKDISLLAEGVFKNFGRYLVDFFSLGKNKEDFLKKNLLFEGLENIDEALKLGKGCIILTGHFGNWELAGYVVAGMGYKLNAVALAHADSRINNLFIEQRRKSGTQVIPISSAKKSCLAALERNELIAILGDRPYRDHGIEVNFFGRTAIVPRGAALFSIKNSAPIITAFTYKEDEEKDIYKLVFKKLVYVEQGDSTGELLENITQNFIRRFESYIQKYPSQWYMFNKVWKN
ncbi:MAG: hypothetical protein U9R52_00450 [Candidatus Omnitrophota bacterium]|nr:hypothetical protein [Candidatus Omnitrophota bacterium]